MLNIDRNNSHTFPELIELLKGKNVYIQTHNFPDPDAIGSAFGLQKLLEYYGITSRICYNGKIDRINTKRMLDRMEIELYDKAELESEIGPDDPIICVDSQKSGGNITDLVGDEVACIDHHPTTVPVDYFFKDVRIVGSCASIITSYFMEANVPMDTNTATALAYGLQMDTNGFSRGVTDLDIVALGYLHPFCDKTLISRLEQNQMEFNDLKAYGAAIENIELFEKVGFAFIPFSCPDALIAITCDFILSLVEVNLAIVYSKKINGYKFSLRCETYLSGIDCGEIASKALAKMGGSGGGHAFMASGFLPQDKVEALGNNPDEVIIENFLEEIPL